MHIQREAAHVYVFIPRMFHLIEQLTATRPRSVIYLENKLANYVLSEPLTSDMLIPLQASCTSAIAMGKLSNRLEL